VSAAPADLAVQLVARPRHQSDVVTLAVIR
jgi:hypothetical protein